MTPCPFVKDADNSWRGLAVGVFWDQQQHRGPAWLSHSSAWLSVLGQCWEPVAIGSSQAESYTERSSHQLGPLWGKNTGICKYAKNPPPPFMPIGIDPIS